MHRLPEQELKRKQEKCPSKSSAPRFLLLYRPEQTIWPAYNRCIRSKQFSLSNNV